MVMVIVDVEAHWLVRDCEMVVVKDYWVVKDLLVVEDD